MAIGNLGNPGSCSGSGCGCGGPGVPMLRAVGFVGGMNVAGNQTNMLTWLNGIDFDDVSNAAGFTGPIPWGYTLTCTFTTYAQTAPVSYSLSETSPGVNGSINYLHGCSGSNGACVIGNTSEPAAYRAQAYLPDPTPFFIIAWGPGSVCGSGPAYWVAAGCTYAQQADDQYPMIVDLPIPDDNIDHVTTQDNTIFVQQYTIGLIGGSTYPAPLCAATFVTAQDLSGMASYYETTFPGGGSGWDGFGPNWNPALTCADDVSPADPDPFGGTDP